MDTHEQWIHEIKLAKLREQLQVGLSQLDQGLETRLALRLNSTRYSQKFKAIQRREPNRGYTETAPLAFKTVPRGEHPGNNRKTKDAERADCCQRSDDGHVCNIKKSPPKT